MRLKIGQIVDVSNDVNLSDLSPLDRIIAAGINAYHNTDYYRRRVAESEERKEEQRRRVRDTLISNLVSIITEELETNKSLRDKDDKCKALLLEIPARFVPLLPEALISHEFDGYNIHVVQPSKLLLKFADPPYCLYVESKGG